MNVLLVEPLSFEALRRFLAAARRLGLKPYLLTVTGNKFEGLFSLCEGVINLPSLSMDANDVARSLNVEFSGVVPCSEFSVELCEKLSAIFGLPHQPAQVVESMRNKSEMRKAFAAAGVPQPEVYGRIASLGELELIKHKGVKFPVIVKPVDMAGSAMVKLCDDWQSLEDLVKMILNYRQSVVTNINFRGQALIEQFAEGPEFSVEVICRDGEIVFHSITKKIVSPLPYCEETGHVVGLEYSADFRLAALDLVKGIIRAWNMQNGCIHAEFKSTPAGLRVIEAASRVPGDYISNLIELSWGVSLEQAFIGSRCRVDDQNEYSPQLLLRKISGVRHLFVSNAKDKIPADLQTVRHECEVKEPKGSSPFSVGNRCGHLIFTADNLSPEVAKFIGLE